MEKLTLSASKINLYKDCPGKYRYRYVDKVDIKQVVWPGTGLGHSAHSVIEWSIEQLKKDLPEKQIINEVKQGLFKTFYDEWLKTYKKEFKKSRGYDYDKFIVKGTKHSLTLVKFILGFYKDYHDIIPEFPLQVDYEFVKDVQLNGIIDLIYFEDKTTYQIVDFKTTKINDKFYYMDWTSDTQSLIYTYYGLINWELVPTNFSYLILNHELNFLFFKEINLKKDLYNKKEEYFKTLTKDIEDVKEFYYNPTEDAYTPSQETCRWCDYKKICSKKYQTKLKNIKR